MTTDENSTSVKAGGKTYFFDVKVAKTGKNYLQITESQLIKGEEKAKRASVFVFPEHIEAFAKAFNESAEKLVVE